MFAAKNLLLARPVAAATVGFDASSGTLLDGSNTTTTSFSLTIAANAKCVVAMGAPFWDVGATAKVGTTSMTNSGHAYGNADSSGNSGGLYLFTLLNPPTGAQTITFTWSGSVTSGAVCAAGSYTGVTSVGTAVTKTGTGTALTSNSVTSSTGQMVAQAFFSEEAAAMSAYNQTSRYTNHTGSANGNTASLIFGDATGASTVSFSATAASHPWASVAIALQP